MFINKYDDQKTSIDFFFCNKVTDAQLAVNSVGILY
jgi:hypothetical protein